MKKPAIVVGSVLMGAASFFQGVNAVKGEIDRLTTKRLQSVAVAQETGPPGPDSLENRIAILEYRLEKLEQQNL